MRVRMTSADASRPLVEIVPPLNNEQITLHGQVWTIKVVFVWPAGEGPYPDFDILCHLHAPDRGGHHSILIEVDRVFIHKKDAKAQTLRALERTLETAGLKTFARIES